MTQRETDELYMRRCLELARHGELHAAPNPMVGAVLVARGRIIGEGYHACCGKAHAEVNAINAVRPADRPLLTESTLYVSLEPCAHFGRTPPCAALIVRTKIPRVVVGCADPFDKVKGRGVEMMREAGIEVEVGILEEECRRLNRRFLTAQTLRRPYVTLKWAQSADGYLDAWREEYADGPARLSSAESAQAAHRLRALHQAILVGHRTLTLDHPQLNVRHWAGGDPLRIVLGRTAEGELPAGFTAYADIKSALSGLWQGGVQSLLVEGGATTLQGFVDEGLWDEAWCELSPLVLGSGVPAPRLPAGAVCHPRTVWGRTFLHYDNE